jgi:hypothetical protein
VYSRAIASSMPVSTSRMSGVTSPPVAPVRRSRS